jgi:CRISPR/Cas system CMR-associated protein Cmr1 (group 7 of RAMP superfamily)
MILSGCSSQKPQQKVLYKFDKETSFSNVELLDHLDDYKDGLVISIVIQSEYVTDDYKTKIVPGMTAEEIDLIIKQMREVSKNYFRTLNQTFIETYNLEELGVVEFATYSPDITIYLGKNELTLEQIDKLISLSKRDEVLFIEVKRFN